MIVYKWQPYNKLNGSLFYCFEYASFLNTNLYIVGIPDKDLSVVKQVFTEKYTNSLDLIKPCTITGLHKLKLKKTITLDIKTFYGLKEFLTGDVHAFSNEPHEMFRYADDQRKVTYYGSYDYQNYDVFNYLKLNFSIFKPLTKEGVGSFVSGAFAWTGSNGITIPDKYKGHFHKKHDSGYGNIFDMIDTLIYVHTSRDTNNRIIPEAWYYNKTIEIDDLRPDIIDSITMRYNDIKANGLGNYTLTKEDAIVKAVTT